MPFGRGVAQAFELPWRVSADSNAKTNKDTKTTKAPGLFRQRSVHGRFVVFVSLVVLVLK
jgi:hypothetical protein